MKNFKRTTIHLAILLGIFSGNALAQATLGPGSSKDTSFLIGYTSNGLAVYNTGSIESTPMTYAVDRLQNGLSPHNNIDYSTGQVVNSNNRYVWDASKNLYVNPSNEQAASFVIPATVQSNINKVSENVYGSSSSANAGSLISGTPVSQILAGSNTTTNTSTTNNSTKNPTTNTSTSSSSSGSRAELGGGATLGGSVSGSAPRSYVVGYTVNGRAIYSDGSIASTPDTEYAVERLQNGSSPHRNIDYSTGQVVNQNNNFVWDNDKQMYVDQSNPNAVNFVVDSNTALNIAQVNNFNGAADYTSGATNVNNNASVNDKVNPGGAYQYSNLVSAQQYINQQNGLNADGSSISGAVNGATNTNTSGAVLGGTVTGTNRVVVVGFDSEGYAVYSDGSKATAKPGEYIYNNTGSVSASGITQTQWGKIQSGGSPWNDGSVYKWDAAQNLYVKVPTVDNSAAILANAIAKPAATNNSISAISNVGSGYYSGSNSYTPSESTSSNTGTVVTTTKPAVVETWHRDTGSDNVVQTSTTNNNYMGGSDTIGQSPSANQNYMSGGDTVGQTNNDIIWDSGK